MKHFYTRIRSALPATFGILANKNFHFNHNFLFLQLLAQNPKVCVGNIFLKQTMNKSQKTVF